MKNLMEKFLCGILAVIMLISGIPVESSLAADSLAVGDIVEFGSYPQTRIDDQELIDYLVAGETTWYYYSGYAQSTSTFPERFMKYQEIEHNGEKSHCIFRLHYKNIALIT